MSHPDPYGQQPFGSGPGYPTPPPPKKRTGLVIGAIVAALVVIGGLVVGGIVLLGGDDDNDDETTSEQASDTGEEESEEPTDELTDEPTAEPDAGTISGTNYTYSLPSEEWQDATADANSSGTQIDSVAVWGEALEGSRANVLVEAASSQGTLEEQRDAWEATLQQGGGSLERLPEVTIDGEPAYAVQLQRTNDSGVEIIQSVYLTAHQDIVYSIGFSSEPADDEAESAFDVVKDSWAWTS